MKRLWGKNSSVHLDQGIDAHFSWIQIDVMMIYIITTWTMRGIHWEKFWDFFCHFEFFGKIQRKNIWADKLQNKFYWFPFLTVHPVSYAHTNWLNKINLFNQTDYRPDSTSPYQKIHTHSRLENLRNSDRELCFEKFWSINIRFYLGICICTCR